MFSDPNILNLFAGALFGSFFAFAVGFVRFLIQMLTGLIFIALLFFWFSQGLGNLELYMRLFIENLLIHFYFFFGFVSGFLILMLFSYLIKNNLR